MKKIFIWINTLILLLTQQGNVQALAPWRDSEALGRLTKIATLDRQLQKVGFKKVGGDESPFYLLNDEYLVEIDPQGEQNGIKNLYVKYNTFHREEEARSFRFGKKGITFVGVVLQYVLLGENTIPIGYRVSTDRSMEQHLLKLQNNFVVFEIAAGGYTIGGSHKMLREVSPEEIGLVPEAIFKERKDPKTGFVYGRVNPNETIEGLTQINGVAIGELEKRMRPMQMSGVGFLGKEESLLAVLKNDNTYVQEQGYTHQQLAFPLIYAMTLHRQIAASTDRIPLEYMYNETRYIIKTRTSPGAQKSPFNDDLEAAQDFTITNLETGETIEFSAMVPHYIWRYGFYEGNTSYRVEPSRIIEVFFKKARDDDPIVKARKNEEAVIDTLGYISKLHNLTEAELQKILPNITLRIIDFEMLDILLKMFHEHPSLNPLLNKRIEIAMEEFYVGFGNHFLIFKDIWQKLNEKNKELLFRKLKRIHIERDWEVVRILEHLNLDLRFLTKFILKNPITKEDVLRELRKNRKTRLEYNYTPAIEGIEAMPNFGSPDTVKGSIIQGTEAEKEFNANRKVGKYKPLKDEYPDIFKQVQRIAGEKGISLDGIIVYGITSIVKGKEDFVHGYFDRATNELFLSIDIIQKAKAYDVSSGTKLLDEYIDHELRCRGENHQELRIQQRQKYHRHGNYKDTTEDEGRLRDIIREDTDMRVVTNQYIETVKSIKEKTQGQEVILAFDTDIGDISSNPELLRQIGEVVDLWGNIDFIADSGGTFLEEKINTKVGKLQKKGITSEDIKVIVVTNKRDKFKNHVVTLVDDTAVENYIPILEILSFALTLHLEPASTDKLKKLYQAITGQELIETDIEQIKSGKLALILPPVEKISPEIYKPAIEVLTAA